MKTQLLKKSFILLFLNICLIINAQIKTDNRISNEKGIQKTSNPTPPPSENEILITIEDLDFQTNKTLNTQVITGILKLQIESKKLEGLSYELYNNTGELIKRNAIDKNNTNINLHNIESENYVLNIIKGNENVKTFGFYH